MLSRDSIRHDLLASKIVRFSIQHIQPWGKRHTTGSEHRTERWPRKFGQSDKWFGRGLGQR